MVSPRRKTPSIRRAFLLLGVSMFLGTLLFSGLLTISAIRLADVSDEFEDSMATLRNIDALQLSLFSATRAHQLYGETGEERWRTLWAQSERELVERLADAEALAQTPEERELVHQLASTVHRIRTEVLANPPEFGSILREDMEEAVGDVTRIATLIQQQANDAVERTRRWSRISQLMTIAALAFAAAALVGTIYFARRWIYLPVQRLRAALDERALEAERHVPEEATQELAEIASGVNALIDRLAAQRARQLTFLAAVAHDLRNPMNSLRMTAMLAERKPDPERQAERMRLIVRQVDRMNRLVGDLLDVHRIEAGRFDLHLHCGDVREVVRELVDLFATTSDAHDIRCALPATPLQVLHDPERLAQVLSNLLSNAIKYSPGGGEIDVRLFQRDGFAVIEVEDHGLGIPASERESIFTPYRRGGGARADIPGVGLGLSVTRRLVRAHHGDIEVESEEGRGSVFRVLLPKAGADACEERAEEAALTPS